MPIYPKYTFFEMTTQNGFVTSLFANRVPKGHSYTLDRLENDLVYRAYRHAEDTPYFEFTAPLRSTVQSAAMWQSETREAASRAWARYEKAEAERVASIPKLGPQGPDPDAHKSYAQLLEEAANRPAPPVERELVEPAIEPAKPPKAKKNRVGQ